MIRHVTTATSGLNGDAGAYAEAAVTAITAHWDVQALKERAGPGLIGATPEAALASAFAQYRELGALVKTSGCRMESFSYISTTDQPNRTDARFLCSADYQNGQAEIEVILLQQGAGWKLNGFEVRSDALQAQAPAIKL